MELKRDVENQSYEDWLKASSNDMWYSIYVCAYERWEYYKSIDPERAAREYESMLVATQKGTWWRSWNSLLDNMPPTGECLDCDETEEEISYEDEPPADAQTVSQLVKEMFKLV